MSIKSAKKEGLVPEALDQLRQKSLDSGADDARVISAAEVIVDPRVRFKCMIPKCYTSGDCCHCPPYGLSFRETQEIVSRYRWAIFFRVRTRSEIVIEKTFYRNYITGDIDENANMLNVGAYCILVMTIADVVVNNARKIGYLSPRGFAAGNCRDMYCHFQPNCRRLTTAEGCRHPELSIPSMESSGIDVLTMAARAGWEVYPIGLTLNPDDVPYGTFCGLVLIT